MRSLTWIRDTATSLAAQKYPLPIRSEAPAAQFVGFNFNARSWDRRVLKPDNWPAPPLVSSPQQIVALFLAQQYLEGLAMVVLWGGMSRQSRKIYGRRLDTIEDALRRSAGSIQQASSIANAWPILTGSGPDQLGWSAVMSSKTLNFHCRALGFVDNPPVAIDRRIIRELVWPTWRGIVPQSVVLRDWRGDSLDAYTRYMTAILAWAEMRGWSTTQMEATIFAEFTPKPAPR